MGAPGWIFRFERLINPAAFALFFADGLCLCGITAGVRVVVREFDTPKDARDALVFLLAELERNEHEHRSDQVTSAA